MSDSTTDTEQFSLKKAIVEIDNMRAESNKFAAEQRKLIAEAAKFDVERRLYSVTIVSALIGGVVVAVISHLWH